MTRSRNALIALAALLLLAVSGARPVAADTFTFNQTPNHVVFIIDTRGGWESKLQELTSLPTFVLYGDGTAVWTRYDKKADLRKLMTARLSPEEVQRELEYLMICGFKDWYDRYDQVSAPKLPTTTIRLDLTSGATTRLIYGLAMGLKLGVVPARLGEMVEHFANFRHKDEYEYPTDVIRVFARKLTRAEAKRGYKTLGWGVKKILLSDIAQGGDDDFGEKRFSGKDAERIANRLRNWTLFSTDLSVIFFKDKKDEYQVGYRPVLPHE